MTFNLMPVDNFKGHTWSKRSLTVDILESQENRRVQNITTSQPTHSLIQLSPSVLAGVGLSLDAEGRKKGCQAGEVIRNKKMN